MRNPYSAVLAGCRSSYVFFVVVGAYAADRVLELAHPATHRAADLGQALRAEHEKRDYEYNDSSIGPMLTGMVCFLSNETVSTNQSRGRM